VRPAVVIEKRVSSNGRVLCATGVEQQRCHPDCSIGIGVVEVKRSSADGGVVTAGGVGKERIPTNSCISKPSGEVFKGVGPFGRGEVRIASIGRRSDGLRVR
jgi:hypothetical protein